MSEQLSLGGLIRRQRAELGLTQARLAELVGKSPSTVRGWERDRTVPADPPSLAALAAVLGISDDELEAATGELTTSEAMTSALEKSSAPEEESPMLAAALPGAIGELEEPEPAIDPVLDDESIEEAEPAIDPVLDHESIEEAEPAIDPVLDDESIEEAEPAIDPVLESVIDQVVDDELSDELPESLDGLDDAEAEAEVIEPPEADVPTSLETPEEGKVDETTPDQSVPKPPIPEVPAPEPSVDRRREQEAELPTAVSPPSERLEREKIRPVADRRASAVSARERVPSYLDDPSEVRTYRVRILVTVAVMVFLFVVLRWAFGEAGDALGSLFEGPGPELR